MPKPHFTNPAARQARRHGEARFYRANPEPEPLLTRKDEPMYSENVIKITEPVTIRSYTPGGKGGYGYSSSPLHRLVERRPSGDLTACGVLITTAKMTVTNGEPKPKQVEEYGLCEKCWL